MSVVLLTMDEPIYMPSYIEPVVRAHRDALSEVIIAPHPGEDLGTVARQRYRMFGPVAFFRYGIRFGVGKLLSLLPASVGHRLTGQYHSVQSVCRAHGVATTTEPDINATAVVERLNDADPDLILSIACGQKLGSELLAIPTHGSINLHGSLLPKYRGRATAFWVLYENEPESGVTAHYMIEEFDAGDIVMQRRFDIADDDSMDDIYRKVTETGSEMAIDIIQTVLNEGEFQTRPNDTTAGEYYSLPDSEARTEFKRRGNDFI
jgi:methionyl-tRNA formyltransferase